MEIELEKNNNIHNQIINNSIEQNLTKINNLNNEEIIEKQNEFLETTLGKTINTALNLGIRYLLPNLLENQVIDIKDTIFQYGFKEGLNKTIETAIDMGKSAIGIVTGKFDSVSQMQAAIEKGGLIDTLSDGIDFGLKVAKEAGVLTSGVEGIIKSGKNILISNIESNIESTLTTQLKGVEKLNQYIETWKSYYKEQNFAKMELEYDKIREKLKNLVPIEETLQKAREVENLHKLIRSKGRDFNLSEEELAFAKKIS